MHACVCVCVCVHAQEMTAPSKIGGREMSCCFRLEMFKMPVTVAQTQVHQTAEVQSYHFSRPLFVCVCVYLMSIPKPLMD
jgi:hypothetical protein